METGLVKTTGMALDDVRSLGEVFARSGYFRDASDPAKAIVKILAGQELGFPPMASMMGIHIIEGKPALSSNLMAALIKRSGKYNYRVIESSSTACKLEFVENCEPSGISEFNMQDAQRAGVVRVGGSWSKYPKAMLFARALSQGLRTFCPDLTMAPAYGPEELGAEVNEEGEVTAVRPEPAKAPERKTYSRPKAEAPADPIQQPPDVPDAPGPSSATKGPVAPGAQAVEYIGVGEQANFAKSFREALPTGCRKNEDALRHQWLAQSGFVDASGEATAKAIPAAAFRNAKADAVKWASQCVPVGA